MKVATTMATMTTIAATIRKMEPELIGVVSIKSSRQQQFSLTDRHDGCSRSDFAPLHDVVKQLERVRRAPYRKIISRGPQHAIGMFGRGAHGQADPLALHDLVSDLEELAAPPRTGRLGHGACEVGLGDLEDGRCMKIARGRAQEALAKTHHD